MSMPRGALQFRDHLLLEIQYQRDVIARMDSNPDWDNGIMADIRQEKLELLTKLLEFYAPSPAQQRSDGA